MKGVLHLVVQMHAPLQGGGVCVLLDPRVRALRPQQRHAERAGDGEDTALPLDATILPDLSKRV